MVICTDAMGPDSDINYTFILQNIDKKVIFWYIYIDDCDQDLKTGLFQEPIL